VKCKFRWESVHFCDAKMVTRWRFVYIFACGKNYGVDPVEPGSNDMPPACRISLFESPRLPSINKHHAVVGVVFIYW